jgi:hypothetical protein
VVASHFFLFTWIRPAYRSGFFQRRKCSTFTDVG